MNSAIDLESLFKAGIAAYQQEDYERAIATFSQLKSCKSSAYRAKANMGLVRVYMSQQNWRQAKTLCEHIGTSSKPSLQQWSQKTLAKIAQRMSVAEPMTAANSNFRPLAKSAPDSLKVLKDLKPKESKPKEPKNGSGFQPIEEGRNLAKPKASSGFQPLSSEDDVPAYGLGATQSTTAASSTPRSRSASLSTITPSLKDTTASSVEVSDPNALKNDDVAPSPAEPSASVPDGVSMFHYAYLNGEADEDDSTLSVAPLEASVDVSVDASAEVAVPAASTESFVWPYANRLEKGRALGKIKRGQLWFMQIGGAIAFYFLFRPLSQSAVAIANDGLNFLDGLLPLGERSLSVRLGDMTWPLVIIMAAVMIGSPWLWDLWLRFTAGRRTFSISALRSHSAESATILNRYCRQRRWSLPTLYKLPTDIPLVFSYGFLPRNARLVVSQGLLDQLKDDELATLIAYEMAHWKSWHWPLLSAQTLITQLLLQAHWTLAMWGNRQNKVIKLAVGAIATAVYIVFWLARLPGLGMARVRTYYSDRRSAEITGNPNGLARALAKLSFGLAASIEQQGYTPILIEGLLPLLPVATDLSRQGVYGQLPLAQLFAWDSQNPLRVWMSTADSHPPLGDRLRLIMAYSQHWKLSPEIQLLAPSRQKKGMSAQNWRQLWIHATPYIGLALGLGVGGVLLGVGAIAAELEWSALDWMHKDTGLFHFCWLLGVSVGNILRINRFFPDLAFSMPESQTFPDWISDSALLPASSLPTKLSGTLIGRPGVANWLGQDLLLKTTAGLVKLHFFSWLGPLGNSLNREKTPRELSGEPVQILGWFRRGSHPWIDIDRIRLGNGRLIQAGHPLHSLLLASLALLVGLWLLLRNSPYS